MWVYVKQVIPLGEAIFVYRAIIWSILVEQNTGFQVPSSEKVGISRAQNFEKVGQK